MDFKKNHTANNPVSKILTLVLITAFLFSTSCTTTRVISTVRVIKPQPDTIQNELKKGDVVTITTKDRGNFEFRIIDISSEAIIGTRYDLKGAQQILLDDIAKIEKQKLIEKTQYSAGKTIIAILFGTALIGVVLFYIFINQIVPAQ